MSALWSDVVTAVLVLLAALMCLAAGVGLLRFPDVLTRLHSATKPQILGLMAVTLDIAVTNFSVGTLTLVVAIVGLRLKWRRADPLGRQQLLWFGSDFGSGFHEVVLTDVDGSKLDVDYIVVKSAPE